MVAVSHRQGVGFWRSLEHRRPALVRLAASILKDHDEAEDVVQETLLRVWRRHQRGGVEDVAAYATRATYWNALKRRARLSATVPLAPELHPSSPDGQSEGEEDHLDPLELEAAIRGLPLAQQTAIRLRFYMGLSFREIGQRLSISANTAASRVRYGLTRLHRALSEDAARAARERKGQ